MSHRPISARPRPSLADRPAAASLLRLLVASLLLLTAGLGLAGCTGSEKWHATGIAGVMPDLGFTMTRTKDGKEVTAADYKGKVTLLYFGYTFCPDVCPTALANIGEVLKDLGSEADQVRVLFVTVDPNRDTPKVLNEYTSAFAPQVDGLIGTPDQLAALARRYRVAYSVTPSDDPVKYEVMHSPAVYIFGKEGRARLLIGNLSVGTPDLKGIGSDLRRLIEGDDRSGWFGWLRGMV